MKLTIIETGRPPEPIAAAFPTYPEMVETLLRPHVPDFAVETVSLVDGAGLPGLAEVEAILITGSAFGVYDDVAWISPLKAWTVAAAQHEIPQVGICFGHQLLAEAFGGVAHKAPQGWGLGRHTYAMTAREPWMSPSQAKSPFGRKDFHLAVSHQDQVLQAPPGARTLAWSDHTPHAALIYDHAPILTFQGHPEFCPTFADALIRSRRGSRFAEDLADRALTSLQAPLDGDLVAGWISRFFAAFARDNQSANQAVAA